MPNFSPDEACTYVTFTFLMIYLRGEARLNIGRRGVWWWWCKEVLGRMICNLGFYSGGLMLEVWMGYGGAGWKMLWECGV